MVGKPNLSETGDHRPELQGAAAPTPGLTALDQEREASMADEGGWSGAIVEAEDPALVEELVATVATSSARTRSRSAVPVIVASAAAGLALGYWWRTRGRDV
jgi:hypothetical protein